MKLFLTILLTVFIAGIATSYKGSTAQHKDSIVLTHDNFIQFSGKVDSQSAAKAQIELANLSAKLSPSDVIYLIIDSPGGSVTAGNQFIDFAQSLPQKVKTISIFAASMGYHMSQSFDERLVIKSTTLMSHRASLGGISGQLPGELDSRLNNIRQVLDEMDTFVSKRIGISLEEYKKLIHNELWLTGSEAVAKKHADRLVKVVCSPELMDGSRSERLMTMFGPVVVEFSSCPLITGPLSIKFGNKIPGVTKEMLTKEVMKVRRGVVMEF
jgi:ATP-dependent Clp protease protease subunit